MVSDADTVAVHQNRVPSETGTMRMKHGRANVRGKAGPGTGIRFEPRGPTSYSGSVVFRHLFPSPASGNGRGDASATRGPIRFRPSRGHDVAGRAPDHRTAAARRGPGSATNRTCSPASLPATSPASCGSDPTPAPAARGPRPRYDREAHRVAKLPGDGNPSSHPRPVHRTHHSTGRQIDPPHERQR